MKILAVGDLHGDRGQAINLAKKAKNENVDLVILCGDITDISQETNNIISEFKKKKQKILFVTGNHETFATADFIQEFYNIPNLHGYSIRINDVAFFGCGGANIGLEQLKEEEIFEILNKSHEKIKKCDTKIMVTHVHPSDTYMSKLSNFVHGSSGIKRAVEEFQPDLLLCSHVHEAEGLEEMIGKTKVINAGKSGKIIEF